MTFPITLENQSKSAKRRPSPRGSRAKEPSSRQTFQAASDPGPYAEPADGAYADTQRTTPSRQAASPRARGRSVALSESQVGAALDAVERAIELDLPLNRLITINWEQAGVDDPVAATGTFLKLAKDAMRKQGVGTAHLWVQESGPYVGQHAHILLHVPQRLARWFSGRQRGWFKRCGAVLCKGAVNTRAVGGHYSMALGDNEARAVYRKNLAVVVDYILKDANLKAHKRFNIRRNGGGGSVKGKRHSVSQNLRLPR